MRLSRMVESGLDDYTVMSISGHSSTRMLERYTHPTVERKFAALETFDSLATEPFGRLRTTKKSSEDDFFLSDFDLPTEARSGRDSPPSPLRGFGAATFA
jgi:hypothetical protein